MKLSIGEKTTSEIMELARQDDVCSILLPSDIRVIVGELKKCYAEIKDKEKIIAEVYSNSFIEGVENLLDESEELNECKYPDFRDKIAKIKANQN